MSDIVHPDQTGFLHGRYIGDNIWQLLEIIEHHETSKKPGLVFIADFEKAFNKVRLDFTWFSRILIRKAQPLFKKGLFAFVQK